MIEFSVIIPTHNGERRFPELLESLKTQINSEGISWEVIIVDNNSTDGTRGLVERYQSSWLPNVPLRYAFESQQGVAHARQKGVDEAQGELFGFLDDDMVPEADWVEKTCLFAKEHPKAGAWGSQIHGVYEGPLPQNFEKLKMFLAINERGQKELMYLPTKKMLPPGGGLAVRKDLWIQHVPRTLVLGVMGGSRGLGGEDIEAMLYLQHNGYEIWYAPAMVVYHRIPRKRLEKKYLLNLCYQTGLARFHFRTIRWKSLPVALLLVAGLCGDLWEIILHVLKCRSAIISDTATACQLRFLTGTLISPFYFLFRAKKRNKDQG